MAAKTRTKKKEEKVNKKLEEKSAEVNKKVSKLTLVEDDYFKEEVNPSLLAQYVRVYRFNQRKGNAKAKTRGEVSGSGKKPWRQKYTGRARVGDKRNPLWRHGGVSHGPVPRDYSLSLPKKMLNKSMRMLLSQRIRDNSFYLVENLEIEEPKTKILVNMLNNWGLKGKTLFVVGVKNDFLMKASSNLENVSVRVWDNLNAFDVLLNKNLVVDKKAFENLRNKYGK